MAGRVPRCSRSRSGNVAERVEGGVHTSLSCPRRRSCTRNVGPQRYATSKIIATLMVRYIGATRNACPAVKVLARLSGIRTHIEGHATGCTVPDRPRHAEMFPVLALSEIGRISRLGERRAYPAGARVFS